MLPTIYCDNWNIECDSKQLHEMQWCDGIWIAIMLFTNVIWLQWIFMYLQIYSTHIQTHGVVNAFAILFLLLYHPYNVMGNKKKYNMFIRYNCCCSFVADVVVAVIANVHCPSMIICTRTLINIVTDKKLNEIKKKCRNNNIDWRWQEATFDMHQLILLQTHISRYLANVLINFHVTY